MVSLLLNLPVKTMAEVLFLVTGVFLFGFCQQPQHYRKTFTAEVGVDGQHFRNHVITLWVKWTGSCNCAATWWTGMKRALRCTIVDPGAVCCASQHFLFLTQLLVVGDWRRPHHSSEIRLWSRHLHRRWPVYADACQENGVVLLCRFSSTASDPPICTYLHIPEAGSCPGAFPAGLRQRCVGGYSCPPNAPTPVGSECSGPTDLQSETLRPHHRRTRQPSLAASPGAHTV